jgi:phage shock protein B
MNDFLVPVFVTGFLFVALPWLILHYVTRWKTAATLTNDDERMLGDMYELARRLEDRLETVERLVASDNPEFKPRRIGQEADAYSPENIRKLERNR